MVLYFHTFLCVVIHIKTIASVTLKFVLISQGSTSFLSVRYVRVWSCVKPGAHFPVKQFRSTWRLLTFWWVDKAPWHVTGQLLRQNAWVVSTLLHSWLFTKSKIGRWSGIHMKLLSRYFKADKWQAIWSDTKVTDSYTPPTTSHPFRACSRIFLF